MPFNINSWEILVILMLFVLLFGPEKLPEVAIQIGRLFRELREATTAATEEITRELHSAAEDQKEAAEDVRKIGDSARKILQDASESVTASLSPAAAVAKATTDASDAPSSAASDSVASAEETTSDSSVQPDASDTDDDLILDGPDRMIPDEER